MAIVEAGSHSLLGSALAGDERAFMAMVEDAAPLALRLAQGMLGSHHDAEDAFQEAVLRAWRALGSFRQGSSFRTWFLAIVANQCRSQRRNRWRSVLKLADLAGSRVGPMPEDSVVMATDLVKALNRLNPGQRLALVLRYYLDLSLAEVGEILGVSEKAARARVHRALDRLRPQVVVTEDSTHA